MNIAVLSGKGGTGKTFVSVNLASVLDHSLYIDCDVEEPNGHLFFKPENINIDNVFVKIPKIDFEKCTGCRKCVDFCKFNALAYINDRVKVFDAICHSCGGCSLVCPANAIYEEDKMIGVIESGFSEKVSVITGRLNTGEETGVPIIKALFKMEKDQEENTIIDCPPGSSCMVMESIKDADYCLLVAEPTIFGRHNLSMVHELVELFNKPFGCVLNKCIESNNPSEAYCFEHDIPIVARIPFDKKMGLMNSNGMIVTREDTDYFDLFKKLLNQIEEEVVL